MRTFFLLAAAGLPAPVLAQQATTTEPLDEIVVIATGQSAAVSTTKSAQPIIEAPQSISIVSKAELDLRPSPTLSDALAYTAGVQTSTLGIDSRTDSINVRGFSAGGFGTNNNFADGLRQLAGGGFARMSYDAYALEQVEVLKGPSGALYGQTAPGGLINLVSKRPTDTYHAEFMLQGIGYMELDKWNGQAAADVSGPITSSLSGRGVVLARSGDLPIDELETDRYYVSPSLTWTPGDNTTLTILGQYQRDEGSSTFFYMPLVGSLRPSNGRFIENGTNLGEPDWNRYNRSQSAVASFFVHRFSDQVSFRNNSRYMDLDVDTRSVQIEEVATSARPIGPLTSCPVTIPGCIPGQTINRRGLQTGGTAHGFVTDNQVEVAFTSGAIAHTVLAGVDYFRTEFESYTNGITSALVLPILDMFDPVPRGSAGFAGAINPMFSTAAVGDQWGAYMQDQIAVGGLRMTLSGRKDWTEDDTTNRRTGRRFVNEADAFTWRVGGVYLFENGLAPYASFAKSFQPQVSDPASNLNGEPFEPTTGQQYEAGLRYQDGNRIYITLGAYQITQQNIVTPDANGAICSTGTCNVQTGESRIRGAELEAKAILPWNTTLIGSVTRSESEVTESNNTALINGVRQSIVGNRLPAVADWIASLLVSHSVKQGALTGLELGGGVRYTGDLYGDTANLYRSPSVTLFDAFLRYDLGQHSSGLKDMSFSIYGRNIANKRFVAQCINPVNCLYGDGRSVTARLQFEW